MTCEFDPRHDPRCADWARGGPRDRARGRAPRPALAAPGTILSPDRDPRQRADPQALAAQTRRTGQATAATRRLSGPASLGRAVGTRPRWFSWLDHRAETGCNQNIKVA